MLQSLINEDVIIRLKWGQTEYKGRLISVDSYMNIQLSGTEEYIDRKHTGTLGQVLIRYKLSAAGVLEYHNADGLQVQQRAMDFGSQGSRNEWGRGRCEDGRVRQRITHPDLDTTIDIDFHPSHRTTRSSDTERLACW